MATPAAEPIGVALESTPVVFRQPPPPPVTIEGDDAADDYIREASFGAGVLAAAGDGLHRVDSESGRPLDIPVFPPGKTAWFPDDNVVELRGVAASLGDAVIMGGVANSSTRSYINETTAQPSARSERIA